MNDEDIEVFAAEGQKLARNVFNYTSQREMVQTGKTNRGFVQIWTNIDIDGRVTLPSQQLQDHRGQEALQMPGL